MPYGESILHSVGRGLASGAPGIGTSAMDAFQRARAAREQRQQFEAQMAERQRQFDAGHGLDREKFGFDKDYRTSFSGPAMLGNAAANMTNAQTGATRLSDEISGGDMSRRMMESMTRNLNPADVPRIQGMYDPNKPQFGLQEPDMVTALQQAQDAARKARLREHAGKTSITQREIGRRHAGEMINRAIILPPQRKQSGYLSPDQLSLRTYNEIKKAVGKALITDSQGEITPEDLKARLDALDTMFGYGQE